MIIHSHPIGVCSWSFRPVTMSDVVAGVKSVGLQHVQLALGPLVMLDDKRKYQQLGDLRASGLILTAGMIGFPGEDYSTIASIRATGGFLPDAQWPFRKRLTIEAGKLAAELKIALLTTHIGFVPPATAPTFSVMVDRLREIADALDPLGVSLLLETGQESAEDLVEFLDKVARTNVAVNFDPANMILDGAGDPIAAIHYLGSRIQHVHVKDAIASDKPGQQWGTEVVLGQGQVNPSAFLKALHDVGYSGPLVIEREAGDNHAKDVKAAIKEMMNAE